MTGLGRMQIIVTDCCFIDATLSILHHLYFYYGYFATLNLPFWFDVICIVILRNASCT